MNGDSRHSGPARHVAAVIRTLMNEATLSTNAFTKPRLRAGQVDEVHGEERRRTFGHLV